MGRDVFLSNTGMGDARTGQLVRMTATKLRAGHMLSGSWSVFFLRISLVYLESEHLKGKETTFFASIKL